MTVNAAVCVLQIRTAKRNVISRLRKTEKPVEALGNRL
jgi:hypothetical protein